MKNIKLVDFNNRKKYTKESINDLTDRCLKGHVCGSLNKNGTNILLKDISHIIKKIEVYDDGIYGEIQLLDTPNGNLIKNIGTDCLCLSERSVGYVDDNNKIIIEKIFTYDFIGSINLLSIRRKKIEKIKKIIKYNNGNK